MILMPIISNFINDLINLEIVKFHIPSAKNSYFSTSM